MSWIERMLEERLSQAAAAGELDVPSLSGKPIADLDRRREQGWWADQFVRRERSHDRRQATLEAMATARTGFWRAANVDELRERVAEANAVLATANLDMIESDHLEPFDPADIEARWLRLRRTV